MSKEGLAFLSREEGLRLEPYNDSAGHATIGVGHLIHRGPVTAADRRRYAGFTRADAIRLLRRDVAQREAAVDRLVRVELNQNEFDALVSLVFNIGEGAKGFAGSTVLRLLNAADRRGAADAFLMWKIGGPGLIHRRRRERALFLRPAADPLAVLMDNERRWVREYDELKRADRDRERRKRLREAMRRQRKRIWRAARESGWDTANRRERYRLLKERTS